MSKYIQQFEGVHEAVDSELAHAHVWEEIREEFPEQTNKGEKEKSFEDFVGWAALELRKAQEEAYYNFDKSKAMEHVRKAAAWLFRAMFFFGVRKRTPEEREELRRRIIEKNGLAETPTRSELRVALASAWDHETSNSSLDWSSDNPAWGQCAVTALVVQDYWGGQLERCVANGLHHYRNLIGGRVVDFTAAQFGGEIVIEDRVIHEREYVLSYPDTAKRYELLRKRVREALRESPRI